MPENTAPAATAPQPTGDVPGRPFYETERTKLKRLLHQKRELERQLQITEETIYKKEYDYLEDTPQGNIITGFDGYTKGTTGTQAGGRRRGPMVDMNRVFTRSSITYRTDLDEQESPAPTAQSTPVAAMAPTPLSTSFVKGDGGSNHATPTSASSASRTGAGGANGKKNKKGDADSGDEKDVKKIRTNFGAARK